jgi:predicted metal-binding protein
LEAQSDWGLDNRMQTQKRLTCLTEAAERLGATAAAIVASSKIQVKDHLAALCSGEYTCPRYGLAASCPPFVPGPSEFRKWQARSEYAIAVKIELPTSVMFSDERKGVMRLLHNLVAAVEQKAIEMGFENAKAFAGGSCKELFCEDKEKCLVVAEDKACPHPTAARPSMSGFGIDVTQLMRSSGWSATKAAPPNPSGKNGTSWVAGLILLF